MGQIWALQPKVREAFEKLRSSNVFTADMFLKVRSLCYMYTDVMTYLLPNEGEMYGFSDDKPFIL